MKTDNELIAEFMGFKHRKEAGPLSGELYDMVKLTKDANWNVAHWHKSWDWLMPVVEKIVNLELPNVAIEIKSHDTDLITKTGLVVRYYNSKHGKIGATHRAVVDFIKWYNESKV